MGRPSKIDRLPRAIREQIEELRDNGRTIEEILAHLQDMGLPDEEMPSKSAVGRHVMSLDEIADAVKRSRRNAISATAPDGQTPEGAAGRANAEMIQTLLSQRLLKQLEAGKDVDDETLANHALVLGRTVKAEALIVSMRIALRAEIRKEEQAKMEQAVTQVAEEAEAGEKLSPQEMLERIRALYRGEG